MGLWKSLAAVFATLLVLIPRAVLSQTGDVTAYWEMDIPPEGGWRVGDRVPMRLQVRVPGDVELTVPELPEQWGAFEVSEQSFSKQSLSDERSVFTLKVDVQLWEVGIHETPPTTVSLSLPGVSSWTITARPLSVEINSVLPSGSDPAELEKHDLKPQVELPRPPIWPWLLAVICAVPLLFVAGRWVWQRIPRHSQPQTTQAALADDDRFPEEIALACLDRIVHMDLPGIGALKQHYTMVADCVRVYVTAIYGVPAMDLTTTEIKYAFRKQQIDTEILGLLFNILDQADMVKFARFRPEPAEAWGCVRLARHFVDTTKPDRHQPAIGSPEGSA